MFSLFKKKKQEEGIEYSFVWYKRLQNGDKNFYTQPFRTKVKARNYQEAKEKLEQFALRKMELVIISEDKFGETDLSKFEKSFEKMHRQMDELFKNYQQK